MSNKIAIVLVSGGMDSCVTAAIAKQKYELAFLHVNYGQKTVKKELKAFNLIADYYKVKHRLIADLMHLSNIGGSSLTDEKFKIHNANPKVLFKSKKQNIPNSYVPFRNANILAVAVSWAEILKSQNIYIGAVEEDSSGYPDCRKSFYNAYNKMIKLGTKPKSNIRIITPIINLNKSEIVLLGNKLNAPFNLTWSCYKNDNIACGVCDSCALRLRAFQTAGITDPIKYDKRPIYKY